MIYPCPDSGDVRPTLAPDDLKDCVFGQSISCSDFGCANSTLGIFRPDGFHVFFRDFCSAVAGTLHGATLAKLSWASMVLPNPFSALHAWHFSNRHFVVGTTKTLASLRFSTNGANRSSFVKFLVNWPSANLKVLNSVVVSNVVDVVDQFHFRQRTMKMLAHHVSVLKNIAVRMSVWVASFSYSDVASMVFDSTSSEVVGFFGVLKNPRQPTTSATRVWPWTIGFTGDSA